MPSRPVPDPSTNPAPKRDYQPDLFGLEPAPEAATGPPTQPQPSATKPLEGNPSGTDRFVRETPEECGSPTATVTPSAEVTDPADVSQAATIAGAAEITGPAPNADSRVVLVDAHSLIYQLFHALPSMTSPLGLPVATVHGFVGDLLELIQRKSPTHVICAFDHSDRTFRNDLYDQYKAHRESMPDELRQQIPLIQEAVLAMGVGILQTPGFEADDILATVAKQVDQAGGQAWIVTSDKDCRQLITDRVRLYNIRKGQELTAAELLEDWGIRPDQVVDFQALVGDPVDNVPGIPLIGPKIAQQLLASYDTLEGVFEHAGEISGKKRRENLQGGRDAAMLSRELVKLRDDVPCDPPWEISRMRGDLPKLVELLDRFGFRKLRSRVLDFFGDSGPRGGMAVREGGADGGSSTAGATSGASTAVGRIATTSRMTLSDTAPIHYETIVDVAGLERLVEKLSSAKRIAIDTETTSTSARGCDLVGISVAWQPGHAAYLPVLAPEGVTTLSQSEVIEALRPVLENPQIGKVGHNLKFDIVVLRSAGIELRGELDDTMVADYLINPGGRNHTLSDVAKRYLDHDMTPIKDLIGSGKHEITMDRVPLQRISHYACEDVDVPLRVLPQFTEPLESLGLSDLYRELELPLLEVLAEMEFNGIRVDGEHLNRMSGMFAERIIGLRAEIQTAAGSEFNLDSPKQLAKVLFEDLGLPVVKKTKTGASTDVDVLQTLAAFHPLPAKLIEYRQATKLKNTYIDALPKLINPKTGRVHTSFRQDVAATGRLSSSEPNLQNIPIRTVEGRAIRGAFRAGPDDWLLLAADYSQIELRVLAHFSGDAALVDAYEQDRDVHTRVAAEVHGIDEADVTPEMRRVAKTINFGIVYGQSPFGLARTLAITKEEAAVYIELYFQRYPGVQDFMLGTLNECRRRGFVTTILGRRRDVQSVRDLSQMEPAKRRNLTETERIAINTVIQGSAADLIKRAMIAVHRRLRPSGLRANLLLQIHDELVWEVHPDDVEGLRDLARQEMTEVMKLRVPLKVEIGWGATWADLK
ncbi:MAG: DNA polymerase I [Planctomycetaceae bacterium]|nr:MAG: DNA polymerase I [Planctomycetaceae bacterium]